MPSEEKKVGASWLGCYARACSFVGVINSHVERSFLAFFNVYVFYPFRLVHVQRFRSVMTSQVRLD